MKKLFLGLVVMFVMSGITTGYAEVHYLRGPDSRISIQCLQGTNYMNSPGAQLSSSIVAGHKVLGFSFTDSSAGGVGIYDEDAAAGRIGGNLFGDTYVAAGGVSTIMFPLPKTVVSGVVVAFSNATGAVTIYYE